MSDFTVKGFCPACGAEPLVLGSGGYVTCGHLDCPDPCAADTIGGVRWPPLRKCPTCKGTGINPVSTRDLCPKCNGEKTVR